MEPNLEAEAAYSNFASFGFLRNPPNRTLNATLSEAWHRGKEPTSVFYTWVVLVGRAPEWERALAMACQGQYSLFEFFRTI